MEYVRTYNSNSFEKAPSMQTPQGDVMQQLLSFKEQSKQLSILEGELLEKALTSNDPDVVIKANQYWQDVQEKQVSGLKSQMVDPNDWSQGAGYKLRRYSLNYSTLRKMSSTPIIQAIIGTRQAQVSAFSSPQKRRYDTGWIICKKGDHFSQDEPELNDKDKAIINELADFIINGGDDGNAWHGDTFDTFLKKITRDSLVIDQACFEIPRDQRGRAVEYQAVDGATIRIADTFDDDEEYDKKKEEARVKGYLPSYVQLIDGQIVAEYYPWELCFGVRNSTTDINANGYGKSEVEELINVITWMLYADAYNGKFFSQGSNPKGMLKVSAGVNRNRIAEFRQQWLSMVAGVNNAWKIPVIESDKMEWIDLQKSNVDMQFANWQEYLIKISCAIFKIAPEEVGFNLGNASGGGPMFESGNESKIKYSKDKGLKPLLNSIQFWINKWLIGAKRPGYEFRFVGIDVDSEEKELEMDIKRVGSFWSLKEVRRKNNLPEDIEEGDVILNSAYLQFTNQQAMAQSQMESTQMVDQDQQDDVWNDLDTDEVTKSILASQPLLKDHLDNPMMVDALNFLYKDN